MPAQRKTFGITIAGLGDPSTGRALRFSPVYSGTIGNAVYVPILKSWPSEVGSNIQPLEGKTSQGSQRVEVTEIDYR